MVYRKVEQKNRNRLFPAEIWLILNDKNTSLNLQTAKLLCYSIRGREPNQVHRNSTDCSVIWSCLIISQVQLPVEVLELRAPKYHNTLYFLDLNLVCNRKRILPYLRSGSEGIKPFHLPSSLNKDGRWKESFLHP